MHFSHYNDETVQTAVDLVNTLDAVSGEDSLTSTDGASDFLRASDADRFGPGWRATDDDLRDIRALRERLRGVFHATDEHEAAARINAILSDTGATPHVSLHGGHSHLHFDAEDDVPATWLGAVTAMGLAVALVEGGYERFGRCNASACEDVFVDMSKNRSQRRCSGTCSSRENVAAHRARQHKTY